jgi:hypothetical protein
MVLSLESIYLLENSHVYYFRNTLLALKSSVILIQQKYLSQVRYA